MIRPIRSFIALTGIIVMNTTLHAQIITTFAGNSIDDYSTDSVLAITSPLHYPQAIATDTSGNLFIADYMDNRIRKVNTSGIITTIAGNGFGGFMGDGAAATGAWINSPSGIATDKHGNIYFCDNANLRVRKIDAAGIITTIAGTGVAGTVGNGSPATTAQFVSPRSVVVDDSGNIYVADFYGDNIRKINPAGIISNFAGNTTYGYSGDGGLATAAQMTHPSGLAVDDSGNVYIGDVYNWCVRKVNKAGIITTVAGNGTAGYSGDGGPATAAEFYGIYGLATDHNRNLYIADLNNNCVRKVDSFGIVTTIAGTGTPGYSGDGGLATAANLWHPGCVTLDRNGNIFIADLQNKRIRRIGPNRPPLFINGPSQSVEICNTSADSINTLLAIADTDNGQTETWQVSALPLHGTITGAYVTAATGYSVAPTGLSYTPYAGYTGTDSFAVQVSDSLDTVYTVVHLLIDTPGAIVSAPFGVCSGLTQSLSGSPAGGVWSVIPPSAGSITSAGVFTAAAAGAVTIKYVTTSAGCGVANSMQLDTVKGMPVLSPLTGTAFLCIGDMSTLAETATSGMWSVTNATASVTTAGQVTAVAAGLDTVVYKATNTCGTDSVTMRITVYTTEQCDSALAVPALPSNTAQISMYPNPSAGAFTIEIPATAGQIEIQITDMYGKVAIAQTIPAGGAGKIPMSLNNLAAGTYVVKAHTIEKVYVEKITIGK